MHENLSARKGTYAASFTHFVTPATPAHISGKHDVGLRPHITIRSRKHTQWMPRNFGGHPAMMCAGTYDTRRQRSAPMYFLYICPPNCREIAGSSMPQPVSAHVELLDAVLVAKSTAFTFACCRLIHHSRSAGRTSSILTSLAIICVLLAAACSDPVPAEGSAECSASKRLMSSSASHKVICDDMCSHCCLSVRLKLNATLRIHAMRAFTSPAEGSVWLSTVALSFTTGGPAFDMASTPGEWMRTAVRLMLHGRHVRSNAKAHGEPMVCHESLSAEGSKRSWKTNQTFPPAHTEQCKNTEH